MATPFYPSARLRLLSALGSDLGAFDTAHDFNVLDVWNEPGEASVKIRGDDARIGDLVLDPQTDSMYLEWLLNGVVVYMTRVEKLVRVATSPSNETSAVLTLSGRGPLADWEGSLCDPEMGTDRYPKQEDRAFNCISTDYDDTGWAAASSVTTTGNAEATGLNPWAGDVSAGWGASESNGWTYEKGADIISSSDLIGDPTWDVADSARDPQRHVSRDYENTIPSEGRYALTVAADNAGAFFVNGSLITTANDWHREITESMDLEAGPVLVAALWENAPQASSNPNGYSWIITDLAWPPTTIAKSLASNAVVTEYYDELPGMTIGQDVTILHTEAQARGELAQWTLDFDAELDSDGNAWTPVNFSTKVGTDYLTILREMANAGYADFSWSFNGSGFVLHAYVKGGYSTDWGVEYEAGVNLGSVEQELDLVAFDKVLVEWAGPHHYVGTGARASLLGLGSYDDGDEVNRVGLDTVGTFSQRREAVTITPIPTGDGVGAGDVPHYDVLPGDLVTVPVIDGTELELLQSVGWSAPSGTDGVRFALTVKDVIFTPEQRLAQASKKMSNGTGLGRFPHAQPVVPRYVPRALTRAAPAATCLTESFDTTDGTTIGPDLTWLKSTYASMRGVPEIKSNTLAFNGTDGTSGARSMFLRAEHDVGADNMRTAIEWSTIGTLGTSTGEFDSYRVGVLARCVDFAGDGAYSADPVSFQAGIFVGWWFEYGDDDGGSPFVELEIGWHDPVAQEIYGPISVAFDDTGIPTPSPGDEVSIEVTGTGNATSIVCKVNGTAYITETGTSVIATLSGIEPVTNPSYLPNGQRGGVSMHQQRGTPTWQTQHDYANRIDNFSVCPA